MLNEKLKYANRFSQKLKSSNLSVHNFIGFNAFAAELILKFLTKIKVKE